MGTLRKEEKPDFRDYINAYFENAFKTFVFDRTVKDDCMVDTVYNVRNGVPYKNQKNADAYENRGEYISADYHQNDSRYRAKIRNARKDAENGATLKCMYEGHEVYVSGKSKNMPAKYKATLEHVEKAVTVHNDRGRVLAGINGVELANSGDNLRGFIGLSLNSSIGSTSNVEYVEKHPELPDDVKARMLDEYAKARNANEDKIFSAYYTSPRFWGDTAKAAVSLGGKMAVREALGFVMAEIWAAVDKKLRRAKNGDDIESNFKGKMKAIASGIGQGIKNSLSKYRELFSNLGEGFTAGLLASLSTTLINIFLTTARNVVRIIRQTWSSLVEAAKVLFFNKDSLPLAMRMEAAAKILSAGAAMVLGGIVQESVNAAMLKFVGTVPGFGAGIADLLATFCGIICSGFVTVSLFYIIDRDYFGRIITSSIDRTIAELEAQTELFEEHEKELRGLSIHKLHDDFKILRHMSDNPSREEVRVFIGKLNIPSPWGEGTFEDFMNTKTARLRFARSR